MNELFNTIISDTFDITQFLICCAASIVLGFIVALGYMFKNKYSSSFVITLAILPIIVQAVISLVNGNLGTAVAVMGAFSLVRFRSAPGTAREISSIFLTMAIGLATGKGYIGIAVVLTLIVVLLNMLYTVLRFGEPRKQYKSLTIVIPESLDYSDIFDDIFEKYTDSHELIEVKTTNMGSLYKLTYRIVLKNAKKEKSMIDELRVRNGNLDITCGRMLVRSEEL